MGLLNRLRGERAEDEAQAASLARDAANMRTTLAGLHAERGAGAGDPELRSMTRDLLEGEVEAPTADVRWLISNDADAGEFYDREIATNWEGLDELQRSDKLDGFIDLAQTIDATPDMLPREMAAAMRTKTLVLAWAFDETHGYVGRLVGGPGQ